MFWNLPCPHGFFHKQVNIWYFKIILNMHLLENKSMGNGENADIKLLLQ